MNKTKSTKYQIEPEYVERKSLEDDNFREKFDFYRIGKVGKNNERTKRYSIKKDANKKKLRQPLMIGEKVQKELKRKTHLVNYINLQHKIKVFLTRIRYLLLKKEFKQYLMIGTTG